MSRKGQSCLAAMLISEKCLLSAFKQCEPLGTMRGTTHTRISSTTTFGPADLGWQELSVHNRAGIYTRICVSRTRAYSGPAAASQAPTRV